MPKLITVKEQELLANLLSAKYKCNNGEYVFRVTEVDLQLKAYAHRLLDSEFTDPQLAYLALLQAYKSQILEEIKNAPSTQELGEIMHRAPESWGKLHGYQEISQALFSKNALFKERKYIIEMTVDERDKYINATHNSQISWAIEHQKQVKALLDNSSYDFDIASTAELWEQSAKISTFLLRNTRDTVLPRELRTKLTDVKYSFYVELHHQIRTKLVEKHTQVVEMLLDKKDLSKNERVLLLCDKMGDLNKRINAEYANINGYNVSEHLCTLDECKTLISRARAKLDAPAKLLLTSYTNRSSTEMNSKPQVQEFVKRSTTEPRRVSFNM